MRDDLPSPSEVCCSFETHEARLFVNSLDRILEEPEKTSQQRNATQAQQPENCESGFLPKLLNELVAARGLEPRTYGL
jgi:hypothetical protein